MNEDAVRKAIQGARQSRKKADVILSGKEAITRGIKLIEESDVCLLGTNADNGYPNIKAMINVKHDGIKKIWFGTNT